MAISHLTTQNFTSHCFEDSIIATVIEGNCNPIEMVERSSLLLASTIHAEPAKALIGTDEDRERLKSGFPALFELGKKELTD